MSYPGLKILIKPILTALKSVMRRWHKTVRASMVQSFYTYLYNDIAIVSAQTKNSFQDYLNTYWFHSAWQTTFTAETAFLVPEQNRLNPLLISAALFSFPQVQQARVSNNLAARQRPSHGTIIPLIGAFS